MNDTLRAVRVTFTLVPFYSQATTLENVMMLIFRLLRP